MRKEYNHFQDVRSFAFLNAKKQKNNQSIIQLPTGRPALVPSTPLIFSDINWLALLICFFKPGKNAMFVTWKWQGLASYIELLVGLCSVVEQFQFHVAPASQDAG